MLLLKLCCWLRENMDVFNFSSNQGDGWVVTQSFPYSDCLTRDGLHTECSSDGCQARWGKWSKEWEEVLCVNPFQGLSLISRRLYKFATRPFCLLTVTTTGENTHFQPKKNGILLHSHLTFFFFKSSPEHFFKN